MPGRIRWLSLNSDAFIGLDSLALRFSAGGIVVGAITDASGISATAPYPPAPSVVPPAEPALVKTGAGTHPLIPPPHMLSRTAPHVAFQTECCALAPVIPVGAVREPPVPEEYRCPTPNVSLPRPNDYTIQSDSDPNDLQYNATIAVPIATILIQCQSVPEIHSCTPLKIAYCIAAAGSCSPRLVPNSLAANSNHNSHAFPNSHARPHPNIHPSAYPHAHSHADSNPHTYPHPDS